MRKDVKFGLTIGAILVATIIVYVLVLARGSGQNNTATAKGNADKLALGASTPTPAPDADASATPQTPPVDSTPAAAPTADAPKPADTRGSDSASPLADSSSSVPPATEPSAAAPPASRSDWDSALNHGVVSTVTPTQPGQPQAPAIDRSMMMAAAVPTTITPDSPPPTIDSVTPAAPSASASNVTPPISADVAPPPTMSPASPATPAAPRTHRVARGENPWSIAAAVYGNSKYVKKLLAANPTVDPHHLKVGQILVIPELSDAERSAAPAANSPAAVAAPIDSSTAYRVASGDTLEKIAVKLYGDARMQDAIYEANKTLIGPDEDRLKIGWVLKLPKAPQSTTAAQ